MLPLASWLRSWLGRKKHSPKKIRTLLSFDLLEDRIVPHHLRYMNLTWVPLASDPTGKTIKFTLTTAWASDYPFYSNPPVGATITLMGGSGNTPFVFGDGSANLAKITAKVTYVN